MRTRQFSLISILIFLLHTHSKLPCNILNINTRNYGALILSNKRILYLRCECWLQNKPFLVEKCTHTSRRTCQFSNRKIAWKCAVTSQDYKNQGTLHQVTIKSTDDEWYKIHIISIVPQEDITVKVVNWQESRFCAF